MLLAPVWSSAQGTAGYAVLEEFGWQVLAPSRAPRKKVYDSTGERVAFRDLLGGGDVVLMNFWATWCAPCIAELPQLLELQREFRGEPFTVMLINNMESERQIDRFQESQGLRFDTVRDSRGAVAGALAVRGMPVSFLTDTEGRITARYVGLLDLENPRLVAALRSLL